ncbi:cation-translocating P-type ATPase [Candidatus Woesearchaeota archaeon]|nr:cation-translocating P-type ATPase [Candidatus Woesearchaeota archaeon]
MKFDAKSKDFQGLTESEAKESLKKWGYNELPSSKPQSGLSIALGVVKEPMFILLIICSAVYMIIGSIKEGLILFGSVFFIMGIEFYQERKTERALEALKDLASPRALVIREGVEKRIPGREVVIGDLIVLQEGDRVPADATVLYCVNLTADESLLTGESVPVRKSEFTGKEKPSQPGGDDLPYVYSGSMIVQGHGVARVNAISTNTEIGKIGKALESIEKEDTRLKKETGVLVKTLTIIGLSLSAVIVTSYYITRGDFLNGLLSGITIAMSLMPEEFPVVLTVFMALGAWRMSKKNVLTRKPSAIETLGSATVLCTDKTGTLTQNKMTVTKMHNGKGFLEVGKTNTLPEGFHEIVEYGILSSNVNPFDPMEKAIKKLGDVYLENTEHIHKDWEMEKEYPLSKEMLAMSRVFSYKKGKQYVVAAKGAPEAVFDLCHLNRTQKTRLSLNVEEMASECLRVLGVAKSVFRKGKLPKGQHEFKFEFVGLIGLSDPIRENVKQAIGECHNAGIKVIMITGDYPVTAKNIAKQIGLKNPDKVITGQELQEMSEEELKLKIRNVNVFARVVPEQKLKIVNALKKNGEIVAMTGDGVNDAPALKSAHIGIAMGEKGTDVAREASSLVLMDDNFLSIVGAVKMGRRIFDNMQKALDYILAIHIPIAGLSLIPVLWNKLPIIFWPVHVLFLELIIDPACSIIFESEKEEKNVMNRPPRKINEPFFGFNKMIIGCLQGISMLIILLAVYFLGIRLVQDPGEVRALTFTTLIIANISVIMTNRSWTRNIFEIIMTPNKSVKWVIGGAVLLILMVLYVPFLTSLFQFERLHFTDLVLCASAGIATIIWFEMFKVFYLKKRIQI